MAPKTPGKQPSTHSNSLGLTLRPGPTPPSRPQPPISRAVARADTQSDTQYDARVSAQADLSRLQQSQAPAASPQVPTAPRSTEVHGQQSLRPVSHSPRRLLPQFPAASSGFWCVQTLRGVGAEEPLPVIGDGIGVGVDSNGNGLEDANVVIDVPVDRRLQSPIVQADVRATLPHPDPHVDIDVNDDAEVVESANAIVQVVLPHLDQHVDVNANANVNANDEVVEIDNIAAANAIVDNDNYANGENVAPQSIYKVLEGLQTKAFNPDFWSVPPEIHPKRLLLFPGPFYFNTDNFYSWSLAARQLPGSRLWGGGILYGYRLIYSVNRILTVVQVSSKHHPHDPQFQVQAMIVNLSEESQLLLDSRPQVKSGDLVKKIALVRVSGEMLPYAAFLKVIVYVSERETRETMLPMEDHFRHNLHVGVRECVQRNIIWRRWAETIFAKWLTNTPVWDTLIDGRLMSEREAVAFRQRRALEKQARRREWERRLQQAHHQRQEARRQNPQEGRALQQWTERHLREQQELRRQWAIAQRFERRRPSQHEPQPQPQQRSSREQEWYERHHHEQQELRRQWATAQRFERQRPQQQEGGTENRQSSSEQSSSSSSSSNSDGDSDGEEMVTDVDSGNDHDD